MGLRDFKLKAPGTKKENNITGQLPSPTIDYNVPPSPHGSSFGPAVPRGRRKPFKSYRLKGQYDQPWAGDNRLKRTKYGNMIVWGFVAVGFCLCAYLSYDGATSVKDGDYCLVMEDHFDKSGIDDSHWTHEVQIGGFGTGSFDWTTTDSKNTFTDGQGLHIVPTLTTESTSITDAQLLDGYTLNLTKTDQGDGSCTSDDYKQCSIKSNNTLGTIIPPVRSARLSTKGKKSIKYGRVEVVAKMPRGDWLWPAIWMMPEDSKYGPWPASGEIDIAEFRGNSWHYPLGNDAMTSTLHWGPTTKLDMYWQTYGTHFLKRTDFTKAYHTFGLEWTKDYLFTYLDSKLKQVFYLKFAGKQSLWERAHFDGATANGSVIENPWKATGNVNTPFDENFYLILNVAVGAQNGWFFDGQYQKPWVDNGPTAARDFIKAKDQWLPTWGTGNDRGMTVQSVKMWQEGKC